MEPISSVTSMAVPLDRSDVDTDQIIPASWLKRVERTGFGEGLFSEWRKDDSFVLNSPIYAGAQILIAGPNFGTGSSREHAVWALQDWGFKAVISPKFGDIFKNNCTKVGVIPAEIDAELGRQLLAAVLADHNLAITVDVVAGEVRCESLNLVAPFAIDEFTRERFIQGLDDIGLTLRNADAIDAYEATRASWLPVAN